ncbi:hypothetical protein CMI37_27285 [Candidatus Pacearchaeota archaeon]|nr:hypothetical protein [Candidatus Pacearchaeota archaeon]|tara:strand:- start:58 stop:477 length:420 start_codon:yes stop_codon:yes gene_type:complete
MALDLPGPSGIPGIVGGHTTVGPSSYRSAESAQEETFKFLSAPDSDYNEVHTVPTGKSFYVTNIIFNTTSTSKHDLLLATGAAASEVDILIVTLDSDGTAGASKDFSFITPMKFSTGTRLSFKSLINSSGSIMLVGWEE